MDLLGDYGDVSEDEEEGVQENQGNGASGAPAVTGLSSLVGEYEGGEGEEGSGSDDGRRAGGDAAASGQASTSPSSQVQDGTPSGVVLGKVGLRIRSKPATPAGGSPYVKEGATSDIEDGMSPVVTSSVGHTAAQKITQLLPIDESQLPPEPTEECNPDVVKNVEKVMRLSAGVVNNNGTLVRATVNTDLRDKKEFHNPGILEFLMSTYKIKETGSNYPKELFDPDGYAYQMFADSLQRASTRAQQEYRANRTTVDFVSGGQQPPPQAAAAAARPMVTHVNVPAARAPSLPGGLPGGAGASAMAMAAAQTQQAAAAGGGAEGGARKRSKWDQASKGGIPGPPAGMPPNPAMPASTGIAIADFMRVQQMQGMNKPS